MAAGAASAQQAATAASKINGGGTVQNSFEADNAAFYSAQGMRGVNGYVNKVRSSQKILDEAEQNLKRVNYQMELDQKAIEYAAAGFGEAATLLSNYSDSFIYASSQLANQQRQSRTATSDAINSYRYGGQQGSVSPQVNIQTGPVTQMDGTNYVTTSDLSAATSSAAQQGANLAISQLQNNPRVRRSIGVS